MATLAAVTSDPLPPQIPPDADSDPSRGAEITVASAFADLVAGSVDLSDAQFAALSDLDDGGAAGFVATLTDLEAVARFALLDALVEAERASHLLNFSAFYRAARHDDDAGVRGIVIAGLALSEAPEIVPDLLEAAQSDPEEAVRSEAAVALGGSALQAELGHLRPRLAEDVVEGLQRIATDPSEDPTVQASAIASLGVVDRAWVQDLVYDAFESTDPALRIGAIQAMGRTADEYWLPTLVNAMDSADSDERYAAARAAGDIASEDAIVPLTELLDDEALDVVEAAAAALGEIGGQVVTEQLEQYASHPDTAVRTAIQLGLAAAAFDDDPLGLAAIAEPFRTPVDRRDESPDDFDGWPRGDGGEPSDD